MPPPDVGRQVGRLAMSLGLDHAIVTEAVTDAVSSASYRLAPGRRCQHMLQAHLVAPAHRTSRSEQGQAPLVVQWPDPGRPAVMHMAVPSLRAYEEGE